MLAITIVVNVVGAVGRAKSENASTTLFGVAPAFSNLGCGQGASEPRSGARTLTGARVWPVM